jgi:hypothetical protein
MLGLYKINLSILSQKEKKNYYFYMKLKRKTENGELIVYYQIKNLRRGITERK